MDEIERPFKIKVKPNGFPLYPIHFREVLFIPGRCFPHLQTSSESYADLSSRLVLLLPQALDRHREAKTAMWGAVTAVSVMLEVYKRYRIILTSRSGRSLAHARKS